MEWCRDIIATNPGFSVHFIRRQANDIAHVLAKHFRFYASPFIWVETPSYIDDLMNMYYFLYWMNESFFSNKKNLNTKLRGYL